MPDLSFQLGLLLFLIGLGITCSLCIFCTAKVILTYKKLENLPSHIDRIGDAIFLDDEDFNLHKKRLWALEKTVESLIYDLDKLEERLNSTANTNINHHITRE